MAEAGQEERLLGGHYRVLRQLSRGSFGDTYLAEDTHRFQELCVLKEFNPQVPGKLALDKAQTLFEREASILYQINHPQVPRFRELLRDQGRLFLVQDYVEGPTYRELLDRRRAVDERFSEAEGVQFLMQTLPLLQYLHSIGIVHRNISPDNLIQRNADGRPVLIDFGGVKQLVVNVRHQLGVAQPYQAADGTITRLGTVGYAPEEQLESGQVSPVTDLYALGMTTLVLLTGKDPDELYDDRRDRWVWPQQVELSATLSQVLTQLVAHDPSDRYQSAGQAMAALNLAHPDAFSAAWSQPMPIRMQPTVPPPRPEPPPAPTVAIAPAAPYAPPMAHDPTATVAPPPRAVPVQKTSSGWWPALAGLLVIVGVAGGLWWWLDPLSQFGGDGSEVVSPGGSDASNPNLSEAERDRKQALRDRAVALSVDWSYVTSLTDQLFYEQNPDRQGTQLTDQPQDEPLRIAWDAIAANNLDLIEANLSTDARSKLGRYNPTDSDRWKRQVNALYVSSNALYDLADARFSQLFSGRPREGFVETPVDQIWFALAQDQVNAMESGENLTEVTFEQGTFNQQQEGNLSPGHGQIYIVNLTAQQLLRLNLQAPPESTRLSLYVPVPTDELPYILADAEQNTWAGELPQSGYYEIVVVSQAENVIPYRLTVAVDNVINDIINQPDPPEKNN
ncbi:MULTISPECIES: serine/threonine-protein kinase [Cyanophyceae]|uniref:serine/threonine-protein kinase n=1 Tax=Cyanophyceae TaxID=3028117 RepID=UPI0016881DFD|nr:MULTISPECIES: serine/threonine-protein kinase [Cyanophyceae]MBD1916750.1 protein kinase [Phormidium sp. FACHB-77]MBD2029380.1 protein kinase [Phormidium sp. FACHB-322]MBD2051955.1 protein kinase [Leptolyngbya sp. FACHB-60]